MAKGGPCGIWAMKDGDYEAHVFEGTDTGLTAALAYVGSNGVVHVYPGSSTVTIPTVAAGVRLTKHEAGVESTYGPSTTEYDRTGDRKSLAYNVLDYADVATAIAAVPAGGRLYFPMSGGPYTPPDDNGWTISKAIEIFSDGEMPLSASIDNCFNFYGGGGNAHKNSTVFRVTDTARRVYLHDFFIYGTGAPPTATDGTGDGIRIDSTLGEVNAVRIERVRVEYAGRSGIRVTGANYTNLLRLHDVSVFGCRGHGLYLNKATMVSFSNVNTTNNYLSGAYFETCGNGDIHIESGINGEGLASTTLNGDIVLNDCANFVLQGGNCEEFTTYTCKNGILLLGSRGCVIGGMELDNAVAPATALSRGIYLRGGSYGNTILSNNHSQVDTLVEIDSASADIGNTIHPQAVFSSDATNAVGKVVLPTGGKNFGFIGNLTSGVSDNKGVGFLLPSMAHTSAVSSAVVQDGLMVYDSTNAQMRFRIGGAWYSAVVSAT